MANELDLVVLRGALGLGLEHLLPERAALRRDPGLAEGADHLLGLVAEQLAQARARVRDDSVGVAGEQPFVHALDEGAIEGVAVREVGRRTGRDIARRSSLG